MTRIKKYNENLNKHLDLQETLKELTKYNLIDHYFSLTVNKESLVPNYKKPKFDINHINQVLKDKDIKTFNLTITNLSGDWDEKKYEGFWYDVDLIIYSDGLRLVFRSNNISTDSNGIEVNNIEKLIEIYGLYKDFSKELYNTIKN